MKVNGNYNSNANSINIYRYMHILQCTNIYKNLSKNIKSNKVVKNKYLLSGYSSLEAHISGIF